MCHVQAKFMPSARTLMSPEPKKLQVFTTPVESNKSCKLCIHLDRSSIKPTGCLNTSFGFRLGERKSGL